MQAGEDINRRKLTSCEEKGILWGMLTADLMCNASFPHVSSLPVHPAAFEFASLYKDVCVNQFLKINLSHR